MLENILAQISSLPLPSLASLDPTTLEIVIGIVALFLFLILFAFTRHHLIHTSLHGLWAGLVIGVIVVLGIEGGGYYLYTNYIVGNKTQELPKNFQVVVGDLNKNVTNVLGVQAERLRPTAKEVLTEYKSLDQTDTELVKAAICKP